MPKLQTSKSGPVRLVDIANRVGASVGTVSYVLNGKAKAMKIADETTHRIMQVANELGYVPNSLARSLRKQQTRTIGVVFASLQDDWAQQVLDGMVRVLEPENYISLMVVSFWDAARERREIQSLLERQVEGLVCQPLQENKDFYRDIARHVPFVMLGDSFDDLQDLSYVAWESGKAAAQAVRHLISTGRKRIGFVGGRHGTLMTSARYQAYVQTMAEAGLEVKPEWIIWEPPGIMPNESLERVFALPAESRPDALFILNDGLALGILTKLERMGIRSPQDVALAGMGNLPLTGYDRISLTTAVEPREEIGRECMKTILHMIRHRGIPPVQKRIEWDELISRATTEVHNDQTAAIQFPLQRKD